MHRVAHELHAMGVPLMPRIMTEWAHSQSGADIHPGARIGRSFFIDHATGVVIGETTHDRRQREALPGRHARRALDPARRARPRHPRHEAPPTVEDGVTIYANATVLGGQTVVGAESIVGGSVFITQSVPTSTRVALRPPEMTLRTKSADSGDDWVI